jgi:NAD(P)-dependent dehydrogenase (short-subunit alcohol dehydrogenase family)
VTQPSDPGATPALGGVRALVTGGTSGLGFAMSQALAEAGARVALTGRTEERVQDAAARIGHARATGLVMDVRDEQSVSAGVDRALAVLGSVDVLVNNAGIGIRTVNPDFMTEPASFWQVSPDGFRDLFATNVLGYFLVARAIVPYMLQTGHGKIVNISVNEATMRRRGFTPYGPSRAATDALSHIMAADLAGTGIDVNLLLPGGATRTGMTPDSAPEHVLATWLDPAIMGPPICWLPPRPLTASPISASSRPTLRNTLLPDCHTLSRAFCRHRHRTRRATRPRTSLSSRHLAARPDRDRSIR